LGTRVRRISILLGFAVLTVVYISVFSHGGIDRTAAEEAEEAYEYSSARSAMPPPGEVVFEILPALVMLGGGVIFALGAAKADATTTAASAPASVNEKTRARM
jgi:hypothetical protein